MASNMSHNKFICNSCQKTFLWCKCVDLCNGKFNKTDILMAFIKVGDGYDMKKKERDRRQYFNDNYSKPEKKKIKFIVVDKVDFMDELRKPPRVGTTSRLQLDKNLEALERRRKEREREEVECDCGAIIWKENRCEDCESCEYCCDCGDGEEIDEEDDCVCGSNYN